MSRRSLPTYAGVVIAALGLVTVAFAWGRTAGLTKVADQIPYVIGGGFFGLAFLAIGLTAISIGAKHADAAERQRQLAELRELVGELRRAVGDDER